MNDSFCKICFCHKFKILNLISMVEVISLFENRRFWQTSLPGTNLTKQIDDDTHC